MKKIVILLIAVLLLSGCTAVETFETISDVYGQQEMPVQREILLEIPQEEAVEIISIEDRTLYLCGSYEITVETFVSGDLNNTMRTLSGFEADELTVMETGLTDAARYEWVWTAAGEDGDVVGRAVVLDDGCYHYCITVMADADDAGDLSTAWQELLSSFRLA